MDYQNRNDSSQSESQNNSQRSNVKAMSSKKSSMLAIVILSILLVASIVIGITGAFFTNTGTATGDITLGDPVNVSITQGGASVTTLTFSNKALPGDVYSQPIGVSVPENSTSAVVRVKLTLGDTLSTPVEVTTTADWVKGDDDYYYYNGKLDANQSTNFATSITVPTGLTNTDANKVYSINIVVEAIQFANSAAKAVWETAPETWKNTYGSSTIPSGV